MTVQKAAPIEGGSRFRGQWTDWQTPSMTL